MLRRSPRSFGLWGAALVLALVTAAWVGRDLTALHRRAATLGPERSALVARRDLALGATVAPADLAVRRVHASQLPRGVLRGPDDAVGRVVRVPVVRGGFLAADHLAPRDRSGIAAALPEGTRAVRIPVGDGLRPPPGSAVDVYATYGGGVDVLGTGRSLAPGATLVAAGALVLPHAGDATGRGGGADTVSAPGSAGDEGVTLLVDLVQAAALADASARGVLFLALVPPEDARVPAGLTRR